MLQWQDDQEAFDSTVRDTRSGTPTRDCCAEVLPFSRDRSAASERGVLTSDGATSTGCAAAGPREGRGAGVAIGNLTDLGKVNHTIMTNPNHKKDSECLKV